MKSDNWEQTTDSNNDNKYSLQGELESLKHKHSEELHRSSRSLIPLAIVVLLLIGDAIATSMLFKDMGGYAILVLPVFQMYFLVPIVLMMLLFNILVNRDYRLQLEEMYGRPFPKGKVDMILSSPRRKTVLGLMMVAVLAVATIGGVVLNQDQHVDMADFDTRFEDTGFFLEKFVAIETDEDSLLAHGIFSDSDSYFYGEAGLSKSMEIGKIENRIELPPGYPIEVLKTSTHLYTISQEGSVLIDNVLYVIDLSNGTSTELLRYPGSFLTEEITFLWHYLSKIGDLLYLIKTALNSGEGGGPSEVTTINLLTGNITQHALEGMIVDLVDYGDKSYMMSIRDGHHVLTTFEGTGDIFSLDANDKVLEPKNPETLAYDPDFLEFKYCGEFFSGQGKMLFRSNNNIYDVTSESWSQDPDTSFCSGYSIQKPRLSSNVVTPNYIITASEDHLTYYNHQLEQVSRLHSPNSGFSVDNQVEAVHFAEDDLVIMADSTARLFSWSTDVEVNEWSRLLREVLKIGSFLLLLGSLGYTVITVRRILSEE